MRWQENLLLVVVVFFTVISDSIENGLSAN